MSSYITAAELEKRRKDALRKQLNESINSLKGKIREVTSNNTGVNVSYGTVHTTVITDEISDGYLLSGEIGSSQLEGSEIGQRETIDFSSLLSVGKQKVKKQAVLQESIKRIEKRAVLYLRDQKEREDIERVIKQIVNNPNLDIEQKIEMVDLRVDNYLNSGTLVENVDNEFIQSRFQEYYVLCQMLEIEPTETLLDVIEQKCVSMKQKLQKREEEQYIANTISEIMSELGCTSHGTSVLQHVQGEMFEISDCDHCEVFIGKQGNNILFEPIIESREGSENYRRSVQSDIVSVCSLYDEIERRAAERGVILKRVYFEPVSVDTATVNEQTDSQIRKKQEKQKKSNRQLKEKQIGEN